MEEQNAERLTKKRFEKCGTETVGSRCRNREIKKRVFDGSGRQKCLQFADSNNMYSLLSTACTRALPVKYKAIVGSANNILILT